MVTWLRALHGGKVLSPKSYAEIITPSKLNDGTPLRYSMGLSIGDPRGFKRIGHGGAIGGYVAEASWFPTSRWRWWC
jgi:D-alanyl-D-alanine carboxypeptidase